MKTNKYLIIMFALLSFQTNAYSADAYWYGSGKLFNYGIKIGNSKNHFPYLYRNDT